MSSPRLSVIMAVRNGAAHVEDAVASILGQGFRDFEFLIIDDGSQDATPDVLKRFSNGDQRIQIIRNDVNIGPYPSANLALEIARAPIIARMDADDICRADRLERQVSFLDAHPDHLLVGSGYRSVGGEGQLRYLKLNPLDDFAMRWTARFRIPMVHPSFCFRARYPDGRPVRYRESFPVAQDYALVGDLLAHGKAASISDALVDYRMHEGNISSNRRHEQNKAAIEIARRIMAAEASPGEARRFDPFLRMLYSESAPDRAGFDASVQAFRATIADERSPRRRRWMRRRSAGFLAEALMKGQRPLKKVAWALFCAAKAPDMLLPLAARVSEVRGWTEQDPAPGATNDLLSRHSSP